MPGSLRSISSTASRAARSLERAKKEVEDMVVTWEAAPDPRDMVDELAAGQRTLEQERQDFDGQLKKFEQQVAEEDSKDYEKELEAWENLLYVSRRIANKACQLLERFASTQVPPTPQWTPTQSQAADQTALDQSLGRIVALMERQQQAAAATGIASQGTGGSGWAKLPKQELPKFKGDPVEFPEFWDHFDSSIGKNQKLAPVDKLSYLKGLLEGDAKKLILSLPMTNDSYAVAERMLKSRYEDKKLTVSLLYRKLTEMKPIKNDPMALKAFLAEVDCTLGRLAAQGQDIEDQNFVTIICSKLPTSLVTTLEMFKAVSDPWTVALLRERLSEHVIRLERAERASCRDPKVRDHDGTADFLFAGAQGSNGKSKKKVSADKKTAPKTGWKTGGPQRNPPRHAKRVCPYCDGTDHWPTDCKKYATSDQRWERLRNLRICAVCLKTGHIKRECPSEKPCHYCEKKKNHHSSLCFEKFKKSGETANLAGETKGDASSDSEDDLDSGSALLAVGEQVTLQTAKVEVAKSFEQARGMMTSQVFFDPGACRSYCSEKLAAEIGLDLRKGPFLSVNRFGCSKPMSVSTKVGRLEILSDKGKVFKIEVTVIPIITGEISRRPIVSKRLGKLAKKFRLANDLPERSETVSVDLLIGSDYYLDFITGEKIEVQKGLYLLGSVFGYILTGRSPQRSSSRTASASMCGFSSGILSGLDDMVALPTADEAIVKGPDLSDFWSLEGIGIRDEVEDADDEKAAECFDQGVRFEDGRYSVSLPWKDNAEKLQVDYGLCLGRLGSLVRSLEDKRELFDTYSKIMSDQHQKGVIEEVDPKASHGPIVHYIPHHAVVEPQKETTKVRVVYDGSAKSKADCPSLNECLFRGPGLLKDLMGHLIRFRLWEIAIISDIEKAFLQIGINPEDRDALRFLWLKDPSNPSIDGNVAIYRFRRVLFGMNCSPSLLAMTVRHHLTQTGTPAAKQVLDGLYVDNVITGVQSFDEAKNYYTEVKQMFQGASMNMRQWASNSTEFSSHVPQEDQIKSKETKVLGVKWKRIDDTISISVGKCDALPTTKRSMLREISKVFDPLGLMAPVTITGKILVQELSKRKAGWDSLASKVLQEKCRHQVERIKEIPSLLLPRKTPADGRLTLIAFTDASASSYATAVYLRNERDGTVDVNLIMCKSRVNPGGQLTIPKLELIGILIGARALKFVKEQVRRKIDDTVLFCDSKCALYWVKTGKPTGIFSRNRVKDIVKLSSKTLFRYVATDENPADWATRGRTVQELTSVWWHGPAWLVRSQSEWPETNFDPFIPCEGNTRAESPIIHEASLVGSEKSEPPLGLEVSQYSLLTKLLRVTAWCLRFLEALKGNRPSQRHLSADEVNKARGMWEKSIQTSKFGDVIEQISQKKRHRLTNVGAFVDEEGYLRCQNRLGNADLPWDERYPKILPKDDEYVKLMIENLHVRLAHATTAHTLNQLRREYWLVRGRSQVGKVLNQCVVCKKATGKAFATPQMPELPKSRATPSPCFTHTGVDYFGPVKIRGELSTQKAWICLFTCLATRAIHLELAGDFSAEQFLHCLRRFMARRGKPDHMVSDNGTQFKVASEITRDGFGEVLEDERVANFSSKRGIHWTFIPSFAPYMGGVYERMVGIVKSSLRKSIGKALLTSEEMRTVLCEAEAVVNSRPLTYVSSRLDGSVVITPDHFLCPERKLGKQNWSWSDGFLHTVNSTATELIEKWKKGQNLLQEFWRVWSTDYLDQLRSKNTYLHRHNTRLPSKPMKGDLVLLKDSKMPRGCWRMARIEKLNLSSDGGVRSAEVLLPNGRLINRPVPLLIPFEVPHSEVKPTIHQQKRVRFPEPEVGKVEGQGRFWDKSNQRPERAAASKAKLHIRSQLGSKNRCSKE